MSASDVTGQTGGTGDPVRFTVELRPEGTGTFVIVPESVVAALGARGRTSVVGTIDGLPFLNQVMPYFFEGEGRRFAMAVNRAVRAELGGKGPGDKVEFVLQRDDRPRGRGRA
jgi:hypothetical protein